MSIYRIFPALAVGLFAAACAASAATRAIVLNEKEYFEAPGFAFLVFHNNYQVGYQGGLQMFQNEERLLDSGDLFLLPKGAARPQQSRVIRRTVDREQRSATISAEMEGWDLGYQIVCRSDGERIQIRLHLDRPVDWSRTQQAGFRMALFPGAYYSKSFVSDAGSGVFPQQFARPVLLSGAKKVRVAPEDAARSFSVSRTGGLLSLLDNRVASPQPWFTVVAALEPGSRETEIQLELAPAIQAEWRRPPVIGISQAGYHPAQKKQAVLELDPREKISEPVVLTRMEVNGNQVVKSAAPRSWGRFLEYQYAVFDFSDVREPGVYILTYRGQTAGPFPIDSGVYQEAWRPTLAYFLPIQMCHIAVREGNRTWHGACHLDDAAQAPANRRHLDGYEQGARETRFADNEHIPGLDWGGWHDAGDHDVPAGSVARTTLALALAEEEFQPQFDDTTVRREQREVLLHVPDGRQDLIEQIEYGVEGLLASYRIGGHIFPGIIERDSRYGHVGDPVNITDNRVSADDRWVFTNRNTGLQYETAQTLAAASRVLRASNPTLATECLATAKKLYEYEQVHPPVYPANAYVPRDSGFRSQEIGATAELLLTVPEGPYAERLVALLPVIQALKPEQFGEGPGWLLVRSLPKIANADFQASVKRLAGAWGEEAARRAASNPYGVPFAPAISKPDWSIESRSGVHSSFVWGTGWNLQSEAMRQYYFHKLLPDVFDRESLIAVVDFVLGCHPATNESYVSAVGAKSSLAAYGYNRADWSHVPGGVISGASLIKPDRMELKTFPFLWYQTEYVIHGGATYIFDVLAADKLLGGKK